MPLLCASASLVAGFFCQNRIFLSESRTILIAAADFWEYMVLVGIFVKGNQIDLLNHHCFATVGGCFCDIVSIMSHNVLFETYKDANELSENKRN